MSNDITNNNSTQRQHVGFQPQQQREQRLQHQQTAVSSNNGILPTGGGPATLPSQLPPASTNHHQLMMANLMLQQLIAAGGGADTASTSMFHPPALFASLLPPPQPQQHSRTPPSITVSNNEAYKQAKASLAPNKMKRGFGQFASSTSGGTSSSQVGISKKVCRKAPGADSFIGLCDMDDTSAIVPPVQPNKWINNIGIPLNRYIKLGPNGFPADFASFQYLILHDSETHERLAHVSFVDGFVGDQYSWDQKGYRSYINKDPKQIWVWAKFGHPGEQHYQQLVRNNNESFDNNLHHFFDEAEEQQQQQADGDDDNYPRPTKNVSYYYPSYYSYDIKYLLIIVFNVVGSS